MNLVENPFLFNKSNFRTTNESQKYQELIQLNPLEMHNTDTQKSEWLAGVLVMTFYFRFMKGFTTGI